MAESNRLYHYTDRLTGADIITAGRIVAYPLTLHRDLMGRDAGRDTATVVWLTSSTEPEPTVVAKLAGHGWPMPPLRQIWRFVLRADYPRAEPFPAAEQAAALGCDASWWQWVRATAGMVGSDPRDWHTVVGDIPVSDCVAVEMLDSQSGDGTLTWRTIR